MGTGCHCRGHRDWPISPHACTSVCSPLESPRSTNPITQEELLEKDELVRGESAHKQREAVKNEQIQRKKQDKLEALQSQRDALRNVKKQQEKEVREVGAGARREGLVFGYVCTLRVG